MDSVHDLGGMHGHGRMPAEWDNAPFHAAWEPIGYLLSSMAVMNGSFSADAIRYAIERISPRDYLTMSYFERVITGIASLYVEQGMISREELEQRIGGAFALSSPAISGEDPLPGSGGFRPGDRVIVRNPPTPGHSRAPRYTRDKRGVVVSVGPPTPFPGRAAVEGPGASPREPTYRVRFEAGELWPEVEDGSSVVVELFESYLERA